MSELAPVRLRRCATAELTALEVAAIRDVLWRAFPPEDAMTEADWEHALGGVHFVAAAGDRIVAHASVIERALHLRDRALRAGYVEAVAVDPTLHRRGIGTEIMRDVNAYIRAHFELGALGTGEHAFYERLGWRTWRGATSVRTPEGALVATPDEDGYILVLDTPSSPALDFTSPLSCDWRAGDVW